MTKRSVGIVLSVGFVSMFAPALLSAAGKPIPPSPCVSSPNSPRRCPPPKKAPMVPSVLHIGR